ncbi:hypothetical protein LWP59_02620 [Amycolatopsis acidiphila]|uniref:Uncharacterized protein n=1 Tax=Amycolatopsis acidiphila TaxID=715473 RepID=A0A558A3P0_9PSEU|nr:hypothetical protein [Amycolatopsis acidiphila]TVT18901.1 hypothetical protein FNH06_26060 [Amycolatopsis acidiphila]UIJ60597.1 hypothetical protein LWP59_02620 [Amycolatopsis acidiphila]GHG81877.1 hypothetical protein GCM10017788_52000 [Amycolatopsis acidiphila]
MADRFQRLTPRQIRTSQVTAVVAVVAAFGMLVVAFVVSPAWRGLSGAVALAYIAWFHSMRVRRGRRQDKENGPNDHYSRDAL